MGPLHRLRHEAALLQQARHPGVVELVELREHPEPRLVTRRVEGPSLAEGPALAVDDVVGVIAALAANVADLHHLGLVHGAIRPDHVLVSPGGRPVLCGLADGRRVADPLDCSEDIAGLGEVLRWLLARVPPTQGVARRRRADPIPALLSVALRATDPDPELRPSAEAFATSLRAAAPAASRPGQPVRRRADPPPWRPGPASRAAVVAIAVAVTLLIVWSLDGTGGSSRSTSPRAAGTGRTSRTSTPRCRAVGSALHADVDGDGCPESLRFADGVLDAGRVRWSITGSVDDVVTGDWNCDGRATPAFLDRRTGGVYRSDTWPDADVVTVPLVKQVVGATALRVIRGDASACDVLTVRRGGHGAATVVT